jgi:hypothetical protein
VYQGDDGNEQKINLEEDFDPVRPQLVALVRAIFPGDPEIQVLKAIPR